MEQKKLTDRELLEAIKKDCEDASLHGKIQTILAVLAFLGAGIAIGQWVKKK